VWANRFVRHPLSEVIRAFKSFSSRRINAICHTAGNPVWQRNYYEHIIRSQEEFQKIWDYLDTNPQRWAQDQYYPTKPPNSLHMDKP
jgi:putative transposase